MRLPHLTLIALLFATASLTACGDDAFAVRYDPDFPRGGTTVSVFGVFRDGRLNPDVWDALGPRLSAPFHSTSCDLEFSPRFVTANADLAGAVDDYTRDYGPSDELLDRFAPLAKSDAILLFTISGHPRQASADAGAPAAAMPAPRGRRGRGGGVIGGSHETDRNAFELSATLFSVKLHRSVAVIAMSYRGGSADDAYARFADRLAKELPNSSCVAWSGDAPLPDAKSVRAMPEP